MGAGYFKGDALAKEVQARAAALDEQHQISVKARAATAPAVEWVQQTSNRLDNNYTVRDTAALGALAMSNIFSAGQRVLKERLQSKPP
eukprot:NODE_9445_length_369_cov_16.765625_g8541_i0.p1 GENE.NODE_9445_length_369_cov_16.765625_g8541_i0~~NODE_9445_length_369_cov_16.765625_g8541_i0.p1  ORF type:complete len:97 (-),score=31.35 NODE_9445_length_369_cov_16.765625_g8541_i0:79-342(-)